MKILSTAPTRVSLYGGGTDLGEYAEKYGGVVINLAINLRQKMILYTEDNIWEIRENVFPANANPHFLYKVLEEFKINGGHHIRIQSFFDGVIGAGLGSSSSAIVCLLGAINRIKNLNLTKEQIAFEAFRLENQILGKYGGKQDQWASAFGGFNQLIIKNNVLIYTLPKDCINKILPYLVLFYTGNTRESTTIQSGFKQLTPEHKEALDKIKDIAIRSVEYIKKGDIEIMAELLKESWELKKQSNKGVSTNKIDELYQKGIENGALAGKILGAGGGGYMLFIIRNKRQEFIEKMLKVGLEETDFSCDFNGLEVRIL